MRSRSRSKGDEEPKSAVTPVSAANRLRPPGSDWLFAKLYCPAVLEEEFLTGRCPGFLPRHQPEDTCQWLVFCPL